jgi:hypothetical protein
MPLPRVTLETSASLAKVAQENPQHHIEILKNLEKTNPVVYNYLDYTLSLVNEKFTPEIAAEVGSVVGMVLGLLESQAEADEMEQQFQISEEDKEHKEEDDETSEDI